MDDSLKEWVIQKVAEKLPEDETASAVTLAEEAGAYFLEQTGRKSIPARAGLLWAEIALAIRATQTGESGGPGRVASVKRGDTAIEYDGAVGPQLAGRNVLDARIASFRVGRLT